MAAVLLRCLLSCLILLCPRAIRAQAPGDFDETCRTGRITAAQHIFPNEWVLLLDSFDYINLYLGSGAPWTARSFDDTPSRSVS